MGKMKQVRESQVANGEGGGRSYLTGTEGRPARRWHGSKEQNLNLAERSSLEDVRGYCRCVSEELAALHQDGKVQMMQVTRVASLSEM